MGVQFYTSFRRSRLSALSWNARCATQYVRTTLGFPLARGSIARNVSSSTGAPGLLREQIWSSHPLQFMYMKALPQHGMISLSSNHMVPIGKTYHPLTLKFTRQISTWDVKLGEEGDLTALPRNSHSENKGNLNVLDDSASKRNDHGSVRRKTLQSHMQGSTNAGLLFDTIAPHLELKQIRQLQRKLQKFAEECNNAKVEKNMTLVGQLSILLNGNNNMKAQQFDSWITPLIVDFFSVEHCTGSDMEDIVKQEANTNKDELSALSSGSNFAAAYGITQVSSMLDDNSNRPEHTSIPSTSLPKLILNDQTFPPEINRSNFNEDAETLLKARETCALFRPLYWSRRAAKRDRILRKREKNKAEKGKLHRSKIDENTSTVQEKCENESHNLGRRAGHFDKSVDVLQYEADMMASLLANRLPSSCYTEIMTLFRLFRMKHDKILNANEEVFMAKDGVASRDHEESAIAKKFEVSTQTQILWTMLTKHAKFHAHLIVADLADFLYVQTGDDLLTSDASTADASAIGHTGTSSVHSCDPRVNEAWMNWNDIRRNTVTTLMSAKHAHVAMVARKSEAEREQTSAGEVVVSDEEHIGLGMLERVNVKGDQMVNDKDSLGEQFTGRRRAKGVHIVFDAIDTSSYSQLPDSSIENQVLSPAHSQHLITPDSSRTIFLNNLPVDTNEEELMLLYSRCGQIDSIQIYNLRPDLDPGALTAKQRAEIRKKARVASHKAPSRNTKARRTPVYAMITFTDTNAYNRAVCDILRIFGMVVRRHATRSIPAESMKSIFIENLPSGLFARDLENKLNETLSPQIDVCLDMGQNGYAEPLSCEIKFQTFELAYCTYQQLQDVDMGGEDCALHFIQTPKDAMSYWTRKLGSDL